ncbi:MAG: PAS domain-containing protein [Acidobacteriota bacterium]
MDEIWTADDGLLHITPNVQDILGFDIPYLKKIGPGLELFHPGDVERVAPYWYRCLMGRPARNVEFRMAHADGTGYVWLVDEMRPRRRLPDGRVLDVHIRTLDLTALRAREIDFALDCLELCGSRPDPELLAELGLPELLERLLLDRPLRQNGNGILIPFPKARGSNGSAGGFHSLSPSGCFRSSPPRPHFR